MLAKLVCSVFALSLVSAVAAQTPAQKKPPVKKAPAPTKAPAKAPTPAPEAVKEREAKIEELARNYLPGGGGFNSGTTVDLDKSTATKLVLNTSFQHSNQHGSYTRWTDHVVTVTPSFARGIDVKVGGENYNDIKEYMGDIFRSLLKREVADD